MRPPGIPKYGLGYLEKMDDIIPSCRFQKPVPTDYKKASKPEIYKLFTIMEGCPKHKVDTEWMKKMLNWYLFTQSNAKVYSMTTCLEENTNLSLNLK